MSVSEKMTLTALGLVIIGLLCLPLGMLLHLTWRDRRRSRVWPAASSTIKDAQFSLLQREGKKWRLGIWWILSYQYRDQSRRPHSQRWVRSEARYVTGEQIVVHFNPEDPDDHFIEGYWRRWGWWLSLSRALLLALCGLVGCYGLWRMWNQG